MSGVLERLRLRRIRARAAAWHTRLGGGLTGAQRARFEAWIAQPANAREFHAQRALLDVTADLNGPLRADVLGSVAAVEADTGRRDGRAWLASGPAWAASAIATVAVITTVIIGWSALRSEGYLPETYETATGQIRNVVLPDGSVVGLNTRTELQWIGSPSDRRVRLIRGEAYFQVVHDPSRPFRILLAHSQVQVLGTRFDVYQMENGDVRVSVISGTVGVEELEKGHSSEPSWSRRLTTGQQIEYSPVGLVADVHKVVAPNVIRWRQGMLETQGEPLSAFVSDLSRYTTERIVIADPRAAIQKVGGAFSIRHINGTLDRLSRIAPVTVTHEDGEVILGYRQSPAGPRQDGAATP
jgi:transmembrane sensor